MFVKIARSPSEPKNIKIYLLNQFKLLLMTSIDIVGGFCRSNVRAMAKTINTRNHLNGAEK